MLPLPGDDGGYVIDTPGLREVGLWALSPEQLDQCFPEMRPCLDQCRFADCRHVVEPDCAVREAVRDGRDRANNATTATCGCSRSSKQNDDRGSGIESFVSGTPRTVDSHPRSSSSCAHTGPFRSARLQALSASPTRSARRRSETHH